MKRTLFAILRKTIHIFLILLALSFIIFATIRLIPGDPVTMSLGPMTPEETIARIRSKLYFDRPLVVQYWHWIKGVITKFDFGLSLYTHRQIRVDIIEYLPRSIELVLYASLLILIFGVLIGTISALFQNTWIDNVIRLIAYLGVVVPGFVVSIFMLLYFGYILKWFPIGGVPEINPSIVRTGMMGLDALLAGDFRLYIEVLRHLFLPVVSVSLMGTFFLSRIHRASMIENKNADYIAFARVAGVKEITLIMKHLMKPSFIPSFTIYALMVASLVGSSFITEVIFRYPGFARYSLNVLLIKDPYGIVSVTFVIGILIALANLIIDIGIAWLDPRINQ